jgi:2-iminobutanoate/2-iminopropanoate deaminase
MTIHHHRIAELPPPASPFTHVVSDGDFLHLSGIVAADLPAGPAVLGDIHEEARAVLEVISRALRVHGSSMARIVRVQVHLSDLSLLPAFDRVYASYFPPGAYPARTAVGGVQLFGGSLVEVTCTARAGAAGEPWRC